MSAPEPMRRRAEVPPTAGLPPRLRDLLPGAGAPLDARAAAWLGVDAALVACSGTAALVIALRALRRTSARRTVVVPAYTCPLVPLAVAHCGLEVRLCDLAPGGFDLDPAALADACRTDTLAVVPTHLGGRVADVDAALAAARRVGAFVVEDAAQALGARAGGASVGLRGDAGFFSLAVGKGLTLYEGGLLVARDAAMRRALAGEAARLPRRFGWELRRSLELLGYHALYRPRVLRYAYGMPLRRALRRGDAIAAVGDALGPHIPLHRVGAWRQGVGARAIARLPAFLDAAAERAAARRARLAALPGVRVLDDAGRGAGTWPFLMLLMPDARARDAALARLWGAGLGVSQLFIHALPDYPRLAGIVPAQAVPNARDLAARMLTVSNSPWLDEPGFARICAELEAALRP
ncbi:MAG: DegT/DnrJ/EryC1/StrS family aminotransferase [Mizugakiibacter sp.]|uniref:DegT/DnrJ/EryC1/StrS family aminotransferase n=1 Tax=Mizugakiibacter sp. TaxID=1972610 RepID=UPI0031BBF274|nr:DegT/DnrJ/EryC1/StrS family aminotransferase [Xanthomonadaceae bacterium]